MSFFGSFKSRFGELKTRLTHIGEREPLSKLSLVVILMLDIFVLAVVFGGLADTTSNQLATPEDYVPYDCQSFMVGADMKIDADKLGLVSEQMNAYTPYYPDMKTQEIISTQANAKLHPLCLALRQKIDTAKSSTSLKQLFIDRSDLLVKKGALQSQIDILKQNYDTALLEKIADMQSKAQQMQKDREQYTKQLAGVDATIKEKESAIFGAPEYKAIWDFILADSAKNQKTLEHDYDVAVFWFPVKELGMNLLFLLPLLLVVWIWNSRSVKKENGIQILISSHLLVVVAIPTLWKIIQAVIDIIPKKFLENIMLWLTAMDLLALWYYLLVIVGIFVALGIIYLIQKKLFNKERLQQKRLSKGECIECGKHLPKHCNFCPFCGENQIKNCPKCKQETYMNSEFCKNCGEKL